MIKLPPNVPIDEIPLEVRYRGVLRGLLNRIKGLYEAIYDRYGEEGLDFYGYWRYISSIYLLNIVIFDIKQLLTLILV